MKEELQKKASDEANYVNMAIIITAVAKVTLTLACLVFTLTRLCKVTGGFEELVSIFIQMDNTDIKKIVRFIEYSSTLFDHLARKHGRMGSAGDQNDSSSYISRDFERPSSELMGEEAQMLANANLNKKIKKMEMGNSISEHKVKAAILISVAFGVMGLSLVGDNIYSYVTLENYTDYQEKGYVLTNNLAIMNVVMNGVMQKLENSTAFTLPRYQSFLDTLRNEQPTEKIDIANGEMEFDKFFKLYYFEDVCSDQMMGILASELQKAYEIVCGGDHIDVSVCGPLQAVVSEQEQRERCRTYQDSQLAKGALNYMNYFQDKVHPYMLGGGNYTTQDALEMMKLEQILNYLEFHLMDIWKSESMSQLNERFTLFVLLTVAAVVVIIAVQIIFIEVLLTHHLKEQYSFYRRMHENLIPDFVINKEKMIKAKLIKEGFMKA